MQTNISRLSIALLLQTKKSIWAIMGCCAILTCFNSSTTAATNPFRATCEFKIPPEYLSPFGQQLRVLLKPYIKKGAVSWRDNLKPFNRCEESKDPKILKIKKLIADAATLKGQGKLPEASKLLAQADVLINNFAAKPLPTTLPDSPAFIHDVEQWWTDMGTIIDIEISSGHSGTETDGFIDHISKPLIDWGTKKIDNIFDFAEYSAQEGIDVTNCLANAWELYTFLQNQSYDFDKDGTIAKKMGEREIEIYEKLIGNFSKKTNCPPSTKDFKKFLGILDKAFANVFFQDRNDKAWNDLIMEKMRDFMIPYFRSVAQKTPASAEAKWKEMEAFAENFEAPDFLKEIKSRKVWPPECYEWVGTIKYYVSWNDVLSTTNDGSGAPVCSRIVGSHLKKDSVSRLEIITLPGTGKNTPKASLKCREVCVINNHSVLSGCYCPCGPDGHNNCDYSYTVDLSNWVLETVVNASPVVTCDLSLDPDKKNMRIFFENKPVKYTTHSRNGKEKYSKISSPCKGLPGKPADYSSVTEDEGYAITDTCFIKLDPLTPDRIIGKCHLDKPKPCPFWDDYTKNMQNEIAKEGTFSYNLNQFQYDFEVDLRKIKVSK